MKPAMGLPPSAPPVKLYSVVKVWLCARTPSSSTAVNASVVRFPLIEMNLVPCLLSAQRQPAQRDWLDCGYVLAGGLASDDRFFGDGFISVAGQRGLEVSAIKVHAHARPAVVNVVIDVE